MPHYNTKGEERNLLFDELFWDPYPGRGLGSNPVFQMCRELGSEYCLGFNDNGYTEKYEGFDPKRVKSEVLKKLTDEQLLNYVQRYNEQLKIFRNFYGQFYSLNAKERNIYMESRWNETEKKLRDYLEKYGGNGNAVPDVIYEVNFVHGETYKNYRLVVTLVKNNCLRKVVTV